MTGMAPRIKAIVFPIITFVVLITVWDWSIRYFAIPSFLLPTPASVWSAIWRGYVEGLFWPHLFFTLQSTAIGYLIGCIAAFVLGALFAESKTAEYFLYPYVVALQSMPKVALAPLIIVWFGFGIESKIVMVALVCFFPLFVNTVVGLRQTNPMLIDLMRAFSASRWQIFSSVKLPAAAGHIFAGLQISVVLSLIGAVVAEFVSSTRGLGHLINASAVTLEVNVMFAALLSLALIGIAASQTLRFLHHVLIFWDRSGSGTVLASE